MYHETRLTQPIRAAQPLHEIPLYICRESSTNRPFYAKQTQSQERPKRRKLFYNK